MKKPIVIFSLFCALLMGFSCAKTSQTIRIGINAWPGYEFLYLAQEKGFFEAEGVDVRIIEFNSLADGKRAYERGQIDGLGCTLIEHIQILDNSDRSPFICFVADYSNGADVIVANKTISNIQDLKGARVGLEIDSLGVFMLARVLDKAGLELDDIAIRPLDQISIERAVCEEELDAAISYPPISLRILRDCEASAIFTSAEIPNEIVDVIILEKSLVENNPKAAKAISTAFFKAQKWAYQNKEEAFALMGEREGLSGAEFGQALADGIQILNIEDQEKFLVPGGLLDQALTHCANILRDTNQISDTTRIKDSIHRPKRGKNEGQ